MATPFEGTGIFMLYFFSICETFYLFSKEGSNITEFHVLEMSPFLPFLDAGERRMLDNRQRSIINPHPWGHANMEKIWKSTHLKHSDSLDIDLRSDNEDLDQEDLHCNLIRILESKQSQLRHVSVVDTFFTDQESYHGIFRTFSSMSKLRSLRLFSPCYDIDTTLLGSVLQVLPRLRDLHITHGLGIKCQSDADSIALMLKSCASLREVGLLDLGTVQGDHVRGCSNLGRQKQVSLDSIIKSLSALDLTSIDITLGDCLRKNHRRASNLWLRRLLTLPNLEDVSLWDFGLDDEHVRQAVVPCIRKNRVLFISLRRNPAITEDGWTVATNAMHVNYSLVSLFHDNSVSPNLKSKMELLLRLNNCGRGAIRDDLSRVEFLRMCDLDMAYFMIRQDPALFARYS